VKAALFMGAGKPLEVTDVPAPVPQAGEALVRVAACGVCHTDLHYLDHDVPTFKPPPMILGHEISGTVEAVAGDGPVQVGDRVLVPAVLGCGACPACRTGRENICASMRMVGNHMDGGYAELVTVPAGDLVPLPDELPLAESSVIADALTTPFHAVVNRGKVKPGDRVAVFGCGGIGINVVQLAAAAGAEVVAVDINAERLELAGRLGAAHTVDASAGGDTKSKVAKAVRGLTGGGAEVAFECIGRPETQAQAFDSTRNGGRLVLVGYSTDAMPLNAGRTMFREMEIVGSLGCRGIDYPRVVELVRQGKVSLHDIVTSRFGLDRINDAFDELRAGRGVRSIVVPDAA